MSESNSSDTRDAAIPLDVVDAAAYRTYLEKVDEINDEKYLKYQTTDPSIIVNLLADRYTVSKKIRGLSESEQDSVLRAHTKVKKLKEQASKAKAKAFGSRRGKRATISVIPRNKRAEILEYFGRYFTLGEVYELVHHKWGFRDVTKAALQEYRKSHLELVKQRQEEYKRDFADIRLGYKRGRLEELSYLYRTRKSAYGVDMSREESREMRAVLEQIRKEVEGDKLTIDASFNVAMDEQVEMHVMNQLMNSLSIKSLIVARVAARLGVPVDKLLEHLYSSYYSKFSGFGEPIRDTVDDAKIIYPSQLLYDFSKLKEKSDGMRLTGDNVTDAEVLDDESKGEAEDTKQKLMKLLFNKKASASEDDGRGRSRSLD